jgi:hypothetical protein
MGKPSKHGVGITVYFIALMALGTFLLYRKNWNFSLLEDALLIGTTTSIIGSFAFISLLWLLKPNISIAKDIAVTNDKGGNTVYLFKLVNNSWFFSLYSVKVNLYLVSQETVDGGINSRFDRLKVKKERITQIPNRLSNGDNAFYAQILTSWEPLEQHLNKKSNHIELQIKAQHALSGFSKVFSQKYHTNSRIKNGRFAHGDNFSVN